MSFAVKQRMPNGSIHVFIAESHRIDGKGTPRQTRRYLGVLAADGVELLLGKSSEELSEADRKLIEAKGLVCNGKHVVHTSRVARQIPDAAILSAVSTGHVLEYGRPLLLSSLADRLGLRKALEMAYGKDDASVILSAGIYEVCTGEALCRLQEWAADTILSDDAPGLCSAALTRVCRRIGKNEEAETVFHRQWFKACGMPRALISDTTSVSGYSEKLACLEWGYNRDHEELPQINLNMVYSREKHLPLYLRMIFGSVSDVATIVTTAKIIGELGLRRYSFALDRGFFSEENLWYFHDNGIDFTIGVPLDANRQTTASRLLDRCRDRLHAFNSVISFDGTTLNHTTATYIFRRKNDRTGYKETFKATAHIYLDQARRAEETQKLQELLQGVLNDFARSNFDAAEHAVEWLAAKVGKSRVGLFVLTEPSKAKGKCPIKYALSKDGCFRLHVRELEYTRITRNLGIFVILNSKPEADGEQTLKDNRSRDLQEKVFDILKNSTGNNRLRVSNDDTLKGRLLIAFVAVVLHKAIENELRAADMLADTSVNKALDLARKFNVLCLDGRRRMPLEVPKKSRIIYEVISPGLLKANGVEPGDAAAATKAAKRE